MRSLAAPPCSRCGSKNTYADAIEVPTSLDPIWADVPVIPGTIHCRDCESDKKPRMVGKWPASAGEATTALSEDE